MIRSQDGRLFAVDVDIDAPPERVWTVMCDIERWQEWTPSVTSIRKLDGGPLAVGTRARIRQPGFPSALWRVSEIEAGRQFTWVSWAPGLLVTARHGVVPIERGTRATLSVHYGGLFGSLMGRLTSRVNEKFLGFEAAGLKRRSEADR